MDTSGSHTPKQGRHELDLPKTLITESGASGAGKQDLLHVGQVISERYRVISVIGCGGMGAVYKVEQMFLKQMFALKTLHGQALTEVGIRRFHKEAQAASKLSHPNLVRAHDFGVLENQQPFYVMDLVEGQNLSEYSRKVGALSIDEVLDIFIPVCFGLGYAHEQGVIHRDIKPGNIMLAISPQEASGYIPKVVDFGIAKFTETEERHTLTLTRTGEVFGTPIYMSPEQCTGVKVDHRSDIYSLGCVMYESLTGAPPFHGDTALNLMMNHQSVIPISLKEASMGREFPSLLEAIVAKTLIKDPNARYQSFFELARELAILKQELSSPASKKTLSKTFSKTVKDIPASLYVTSKPEQAKARKAIATPVAGVVGAVILISGVGLGMGLNTFLTPKPKPTAEPDKLAMAQAETAKKELEEAINVGHTRYLNVEGLSSQPVQIYRFPRAFDIGVFKYTHETVKTDNWSPAQGSINVPLQAETYLRVPAAKLYTYPHLLRGFQAGDLQHLHIVADVGEKVEDLRFVYDISLAHCSNLRGLKELFVFGTGTTDKGLNFIKDLPKLESIDVSDTNVTAAGVQTLKNFPDLDFLGIKNTRGAKSLIDKLVTSKRLRILNVSQNDITDFDLQKLSKIQSLQILFLDSNPDITDEGIKSFKNLISLSIAGTGVTPEITDHLKTMPHLILLTISKDKWTAKDVQNLEAALPDVTIETRKFDANNRMTKWNWREEI